MDTARYIFAVLIVSWLPPGMLWWLIVHPFVDVWRKIGPRPTLWIMGTLASAGVIGLTAIRDRLVGPDLGTRYTLVVAAAGLGAITTWIAVIRRRQLTTRILFGVPELDEDNPGTLLTDGIYAHLRHPRYVEVWLGTLAYACFANYLGAWIVWLATGPMLHLVVLLEERELRDRFGGEYEAYVARVPRYLPRLGRGEPNARHPSAPGNPEA